MLAVVHSVEKLVFVDETAEAEVYQAKQDYQPRAGKNTVDDADDEYQERLGEIVAVAKNGWLD